MAKKVSAKKVANKPELNFEQALAQLETIVRHLEDGQLPLAKALDQYEQGVHHLKTCYKLLERAERRIELLQNVDDRGTAAVEPFDETATYDGDAEAASRGQARSQTARARPAAGSNDMDVPGKLF